MLVSSDAQFSSAQKPDATPHQERRTEVRCPTFGMLWLIDNENGAVVGAECVDMSPNGLRVQAPLGYGLRPGRHYEICSHRPGQAAPPGLGLMISRRARVARADVVVRNGADKVELGLALERERKAFHWDSAASY